MDMFPVGGELSLQLLVVSEDNFHARNTLRILFSAKCIHEFTGLSSLFVYGCNED
jgi:hypothetical protein